MARKAAIKTRLEKFEQADMIELYQKIGSTVYEATTHLRGKACPKCGTFVTPGHASGQTEGMSDLIVFLPKRGGPLHQRHVLFHEMKRQGGGEKDLSKEQRELMLLVRECGGTVSHVVGDLNAGIAWLIEHLYLRADSVAHYRVPKGLQA